MNLSFGPTLTPTRVAPLQMGTRVSFAPSFRDFPHGLFTADANGRVDGHIFNHVGGVDVPVRRRVILIRDIDAKPMREKFSNPVTGYYRFDYVERGFTYSVIAHDTNQTLNATIKDRITPTPMP